MNWDWFVPKPQDHSQEEERLAIATGVYVDKIYKQLALANPALEYEELMRLVVEEASKKYLHAQNQRPQSPRLKQPPRMAAHPAKVRRQPQVQFIAPQQHDKVHLAAGNSPVNTSSEAVESEEQQDESEQDFHKPNEQHDTPKEHENEPATLATPSVSTDSGSQPPAKEQPTDKVEESLRVSDTESPVHNDMSSREHGKEPITSITQAIACTEERKMHPLDSNIDDHSSNSSTKLLPASKPRNEIGSQRDTISSSSVQSSRILPHLKLSASERGNKSISSTPKQHARVLPHQRSLTSERGKDTTSSTPSQSARVLPHQRAPASGGSTDSSRSASRPTARILPHQRSSASGSSAQSNADRKETKAKENDIPDTTQPETDEAVVGSTESINDASTITFADYDDIYMGFTQSTDGFGVLADEDSTANRITDVLCRTFAEGSGQTKRWIQKYVCNFEGCHFTCVAVRQMYVHKVAKHFVCEECQLEFTTTTLLDKHKQEAEAHNWCPFCKRDYATTTARNKHMEREHPQSKELVCPMCGEEHENMASFTLHLEHEDCPKLTAEQFHKAREMVGKSRDLALTGDGSGEEFSSLTQRISRPQEVSSNADVEVGLPGLDLHNPSKSTHYPGSSMQRRKSTISAASATSNLIRKMQAMSVIDAMPAVQPKEQRLHRLYQKMVGAYGNHYQPPCDKNGQVIIQGIPDNEAFDVDHFYNKRSKTYGCPHANCWKKFKLPEKLQQHLEGPVHCILDLSCPGCAKQFTSAASLVAHLEAVGNKCRIRYSEIYPDAIEIASGGFLSLKSNGRGGWKAFTMEPSW